MSIKPVASRLSFEKAKIPWVLAMLASAFWLNYLIVRPILGPLGADERYHAHIVWLLTQGKVQYVDFYSAHLPLYYDLAALLVPSSTPYDLSFLMILRALSVVIFLGYAAMLFATSRSRFVFIFPLLTYYLIVGRNLEIRPDTLGVFLFNVAWWILLGAYSRIRAITVCVLTFVCLLISARASIMAVGLSGLLVGSSRVDLQACKLEYSIVSPK